MIERIASSVRWTGHLNALCNMLQAIVMILCDGCGRVRMTPTSSAQHGTFRRLCVRMRDECGEASEDERPAEAVSVRRHETIFPFGRDMQG